MAGCIQFTCFVLVEIYLCLGRDLPLSGSRSTTENDRSELQYALLRQRSI